MIKIRPLSKSKTKELRKLSKRKQRDKLGLFTAEGWRAVEELAQHPDIETRYIVVRQDHSQRSELEQALYDVNQVWYLNPEDFDDCSDVDESQGIIGVFAVPGQPSLSTVLQKNGVLIGLDAIQDPGNLGTIIRSAVWFGAQAVLLGKGTVDLFNPKVVRSTMGALAAIPILDVDLHGQMHVIKKHRTIYPLLLSDNAGRISDLKDISQKSLLLTGNEGHGIDPDLLTGEAHPLFIPRSGLTHGAESLNAGVATSVALYHLTQLCR